MQQKLNEQYLYFPFKPKPPESGPAPLADDGKQKPWQAAEDEKEGMLFVPERMRQGLDEKAKTDAETLAEDTPNTSPRFNILLNRYADEEDPFEEACLCGDFDNAVFLYENLLVTLGETERKASINKIIKRILNAKYKNFTPARIKILH